MGGCYNIEVSPNIMQPYYRYWHYILQTSSGHGTWPLHSFTARLRNIYGEILHKNNTGFYTKGLKTDVEENDAHRYDDVVHD